MNNERISHLRDLKSRWDLVSPGMSVKQAEEIMGFVFSIDSTNAAGRVVYSHHAPDHLPFYLVAGESGIIERRQNIRALDDVAPGT